MELLAKRQSITLHDDLFSHVSNDNEAMSGQGLDIFPDRLENHCSLKRSSYNVYSQ